MKNGLQNIHQIRESLLHKYVVVNCYVTAVGEKIEILFHCGDLELLLAHWLGLASKHVVKKTQI